jgi:hypothetical protein
MTYFLHTEKIIVLFQKMSRRLHLAGSNVEHIVRLGRWESIAMVERYTRSVKFEDSLRLYKLFLPYLSNGSKSIILPPMSSLSIITPHKTSIDAHNMVV